jgi:hypothetical protein
MILSRSCITAEFVRNEVLSHSRENALETSSNLKTASADAKTKEIEKTASSSFDVRIPAVAFQIRELVDCSILPSSRVWVNEFLCIC